MASERNASIKSAMGSKYPSSATPGTTTGKEADDSNEEAIETAPEPRTNFNGKRPFSTSLPPPAPKRTATKSNNSSLKKSYAYTDLSPSWLPDDPSPTSTPKTLQLTYHTGDIFTAPSRTLLIHACNTQGHWGAGIAKAFKTLYPKGYKIHHDFCAKQHEKANPVPTGSAQLIAPVDGDDEYGGHWIGCLFTSAKYGKAKDRPHMIVKNTGESMRQLLELVRIMDKEREEGKGVRVIRMCKINSGKFGVPWERTEEVLKGIVIREGWRGTMEVWEPEE